MPLFDFDEQTLSDKRYQFGWVPPKGSSVGDEQFNAAMKNGWEYMKKSEYPQIVSDTDDGDDLIRRAGLVAMRRPIELKEKEDRHLKQSEIQPYINIIESDAKNGLISMLNVKSKHENLRFVPTDFQQIKNPKMPRIDVASNSNDN